MEGTIGEIRMFAGTFAPRNWSFCAGQLISIASNTALFSILGTTYGGNGQTSFALPDFRGRVAVGTGAGPGLPNVQLGESAGTPTTTLVTGNLPAHNHPMIVNNNITGMASTAVGNYLNSKTESGESVAAGLNSGATLNAGSIGNTGSGQSFSNMQPYLGMNYIICQFGIFPSRN